MIQFYASDNAHDFILGPFETREEAITDCRDHLPEGAEFWVAEEAPVDPLNYLPSGEDLIEMIRQRVEDRTTDPSSESWLENCSNQNKQNLEANLRSIAQAWFKRNGLLPKFHDIDHDTVEQYDATNEQPVEKED